MLKIIDFLGRMSTAVFLCVLLAVASVIGTFIKQGLTVDEYRQIYGEFTFNLFTFLGFFHVYSAPWFLAVLGFLALSLSTCVGRSFYRHFIKSAQKRIYWRRLGYYTMHIGLLLLMLGGILTAVYGFRDLIALADGMVTETVYKRESNGDLTPRILPFQLESKKFILETYKDGTPKYFATDVIVRTQKGKEISATIAVNHPLHVEGYAIYQSSYGDAGSTIQSYILPLMRQDIPGFDTTLQMNKRLTLSKGHHITLEGVEEKSAEPLLTTGIVDLSENRGAVADILFENPGKLPQKVRFYATYPHMIALLDVEGSITPVSLGLPVTDRVGWEIVRRTLLAKEGGTLETLTKEAEKHLSTLPKDDRMRYALNLWKAVQTVQILELPAVVTVENIHKRYYTLLQVSKDPGFMLFCLASALITLGAALLLYIKKKK